MNEKICDLCWESIESGEPHRMIADSTWEHEGCRAEEVAR